MEISTDIILLLAIIAFTITAFVREWMNMAVIAMVCTGLLLGDGIGHWFPLRTASPAEVLKLTLRGV